MSVIAPLDDRSFDDFQQSLADIVIEYLADRSIAKSYAAYAGVGVEMAEKRNGAVALTYWNHDGTPREFTRWRLFNADKKFDQEPGSGIHVYMPPLPKRNGYPKLKKVLSDVTHPLIIAEGETRALALNYRGRPAVAIGGVYMWGKNGELCRDLQRIPMQGREILLVFDADVQTNKESQESLLALGKRLRERGARCRLWLTPDLGGEGKTGADDFIAAKGIRAFDKKVKADAKPFPDHPDFASWGHDAIELDLKLEPIDSNWLHKKPPDLEWTWDGYLPRRSVGLLIAEGGTGKTYLAQRLVQCVAGGLRFLGRQTHQGKAIHIAFEETPDELRRRQHKIFQHECDALRMRPRKNAKLQIRRLSEKLEQHLYVKSVVGQELHLAVMDGHNVVQGRALDALIYRLKELGGIELIVIDPLSRAHSIDSESQAWGTTIINACERIALELGCTVLLTHHTGKAREARGREDLYAARGASSLADAARVVLRLKETTPEECKGIANADPEDVAHHKVLRLINAKLSYGPRQPDSWLYRAEGGVLVEFEPDRSGHGDEARRIRELYKWWQLNGCKPLFKETLRTLYRDIFAGSVSRNMALEVFDKAIHREQLVRSADAKNPRGVGYVFSEEYRP